MVNVGTAICAGVKNGEVFLLGDADSEGILVLFGKSQLSFFGGGGCMYMYLLYFFGYLYVSVKNKFGENQ